MGHRQCVLGYPRYDLNQSHFLLFPDLDFLISALILPQIPAKRLRKDGLGEEVRWLFSDSTGIDGSFHSSLLKMIHKWDIYSWFSGQTMSWPHGPLCCLYQGPAGKLWNHCLLSGDPKQITTLNASHCHGEIAHIISEINQKSKGAGGKQFQPGQRKAWLRVFPLSSVHWQVFLWDRK